jgi:formate C-acetyltransferase
MKELSDELRSYYSGFSVLEIEKLLPEADRKARERIISGIEEIYHAEPQIHPSLLKARLQTLIAENFVPKIFPHSPFFFEMGMRPAEHWGIPMPTVAQPASWMHNYFLPELSNNREAENFNILCRSKPSNDIFPVWNGRLGFDEDHHCIGYTKVLECGVNGLLREISDRRQRPCSKAQECELEAMLLGCQALLKVAERFGEEARLLLKNETDSEVKKNLKMITRASQRIPAEPPQSFYEGLAMLWFLREATASLEGIGISIIGHPDRQLINLYRRDIDSGALTETEARKLIGIWMLPNDIKTFARERDWPETSTCMMLGGCDGNGSPVWNELTRIFIEVHCELKLINPKLNCRYSSSSPEKYLRLLSEKNLAGYNNFALLNDDVLIPAQIKYGKTLKDARFYVNGGCQETICEGVEHSAGAYYYFNMVQLFNIFFCGREAYEKALAPEAYKAFPEKINSASTFEEFYKFFIGALEAAIGKGAEWSVFNGRKFPRINPCPLFSSTLEGCIEKAEDYKSGGAKYNPSGVTLVGLGDIVNCLTAVRILVFEESSVNLAELQDIVGANWKDHEALRRKVLALPRFGHGVEEVDELSRRLTADIAEFVRKIPNERGEFFQPSFFVYWTFKQFGDRTGATPDGRRDGDILCQGIAPHREHAPQSLTDIIRSLGHIDFKDYPGNAVLDIQLPVGKAVPDEKFIALLKSAAANGLPTLQFNCVNPKALKDAQVHPEKHSDIIVRISGLSAVFIQLDKQVQDEIINRSLY